MRFKLAVLAVSLTALAGGAQAQAATVTNNADSGGGSLRDTIAAASPGDTIDFAPALAGQTITADSALQLNKNLTIKGLGATALAVSGGDANRVFVISGAAVVTLSGMTIRNGLVAAAGPGGGGALNVTNADVTLDRVVLRDNNANMTGATFDNGGGAIHINFGKLAITNSLVTGNHTALAVSGESGGGAIFASSNTQSVSITDSTVSGNTVTSAPTFGKIGGGAIMSINGSVNLTRTTVAGNTVTATTGTGNGGGGGVFSFGAVNLTNSTVSGNTANTFGPTSGGGGILTQAVGGDIVNSTITANSTNGDGGGIYNATQNTPLPGFKNTIVAGNTATAGLNNCGGPKATVNDSNGHNLEDGNTCGFEPPAGDLINTPALLGPLLGNGGPTQTHALAGGSPAIGAAAPADCPAVDQRGLPRKQVGTCDIGAWEFQVAAPDVVTGAASKVGRTTATLAGAATANKAPTTARFEFGTSTAYGFFTPIVAIGSGTAPVPGTAAIGTLKPATTYHYRVVARNTKGTSVGADRTFTTAAARAPRLTSLTMVPKRWRLGPKLPRLTRKTPVGTTIKFRLSAAAKVRLTFARPKAGRKVGKRCKAPTRQNKGKRRCTRYVPAGTLTVRGKAGANRLRFQGRLSRTRKLKPGRYRLVVVATAPGGKKSAARSVKFTVLPAR